jgi:hypothetical protein
MRYYQRSFLDSFVDDVIDSLMETPNFDDMDALIDLALDESIDEGKRGKPRLSEQLSQAQKAVIRREAIRAAEARAHRTRTGGSRRGRHQRGIASRAQAIEGAALRRIDSGSTYQDALRYIRRLIEGFDEFDSDEDAFDLSELAKVI